MPDTKMQGTLTSGTGKGAYYVKLYSPEIEATLKFKPFPGTLNLQAKSLPLFNPKKLIVLKKEHYGLVDCYPVLVHKQYKGYLLRPHKTTHPENILEIISSINFRKTLNLKDGDEIEWEMV